MTAGQLSMAPLCSGVVRLYLQKEEMALVVDRLAAETARTSLHRPVWFVCLT